MLISFSKLFSLSIDKKLINHKKIIDAINELHDAMASGKGKDALEGILNGLASYANSHFASEEEEMVRHNYPDYEAHRGKHQAMLGKVGTLIEDYKQGEMSLSHQVSDFLSDWLNKHIVGTDQQYSSFINGVGVN